MVSSSKRSAESCVVGSLGSAPSSGAFGSEHSVWGRFSLSCSGLINGRVVGSGWSDPSEPGADEEKKV